MLKFLGWSLPLSVITAMLSGYVLMSCGAATNPLGLIVLPADRKSFDVNLATAQAYYDGNDLARAEAYGELAYAQDPKSERATVLLGYIYLGKIGIGPFQLANELMTTSDKTGESDSASGLLGSSATSDGLSKVSKVIGLSSEDILSMGDLDESVPDLPVLVPSCAEDARDAVEKLRYVRGIISLICPLIAVETRSPGESRHVCDTAAVPPKDAGTANLLWAFAHLTELVAFQSVLTYSTVSNSGKSNLELRFDRVQDAKSKTPEQMAALIQQVNSLDTIVSKVLPTSNSCLITKSQTQLTGLASDIFAVSAAFAAMPGIPTKITDLISSAMDKIKSAQAKIAGNASADDQAKALKASFAKNLSKTLGAKISDISATDEKITPAQTTQLCSAYDSIASTDGTDENKPAVCN